MNYYMRQLKKESLLFLVSFSLIIIAGITSCSGKNENVAKPPSYLTVSPYPAPGTYPSSYHLEVTLNTNKRAYVYLTLDGSIPTPGMATTFGGIAPIYDIPILQDTWLCYYAVDMDGNQTPVECVFYHLKPPPVSTLKPPPGAYNHSLAVTISTNEPAVVYYTTNGLDPVPGDADTMEGKAPVTVNIPHTLTLKYFAEDELGSREDIKSARYIIDTIPPHSIATPPGGNYSGRVSVTLRITNDIGTIYYTTDGQDPSEKSRDLYANGGSTRIGKVKVSGIDINSSTVVKFFAIDGVGNREFPPDANPPFHQEFYVINNVPVLYAKPKGRYYSETSLTVTLNTYPDDTKVYWAMDTQPVENSADLYSGPIQISGIGKHTIYFFGERNGVYTPVKSEVYYLGYVRPPETFTENFTSTDYIDVTNSTGIVFDTAGSGTMKLDTYHAKFMMNVNSNDVDLSMDYFKNYLVVAERFGGLSIYDVGNAANVKKVSNFGINPGNTATGPYLDVAVSDLLGVAAVAYPIGVLIIDLSQPSSPKLLANIQNLSQIFYSPPVVAFSGSVLIVGGFSNNNPTLFLYDVTNPSSPKLLSKLEGVTNSAITAVKVSGSRVFIVTAGGQLRIVDISNTSSPVKKGLVKLCNNCSATDIALYEHYAFVGYTKANGGNVALVDYSDEVSPAILKKSFLPSGDFPVNGVSINGILLSVSNGNKGVWIYDVTDPLNPEKLDLITPSMAHSTAFAPGRNLLHNNVLFVIDTAVGFKTFAIPYNIGDYLVSGSAFSFNINPHRYSVKGVKLISSQVLNGGSVEYYVSSDGGESWNEIEVGGYTEFNDPGSDLRWKAILHRGGARKTPIIDSLTFTIYYAE